MKLNEKTLLFILVILIILVSIFYNKKLVQSNNALLLFGIILALYLYFVKFTNGRIEKFYQDQNNYENFSVTDLGRYYQENILFRDYLSSDLVSKISLISPPPPEAEYINTQNIIDYYESGGPWDVFMINNRDISADDFDISELQVLHNGAMQLIDNLLAVPAELELLNRVKIENEDISVILNDKKNEIINKMEIINPPPPSTDSTTDATTADATTADATTDATTTDATTTDAVTDATDAVTDAVEEEEELPTQYLKRLFLNKSSYHTSSPSINMLGYSNTQDTSTDDSSGLKTTQLNFYKTMNNNLVTGDNENGINNNFASDIRDILSSGASINDLFNFNYGNVDDLLDNVSKRNYDFNVTPIDFNIPVSSDPNSTDTGSPNGTTTKNMSDIVTDLTQNGNNDGTPFSEITYDVRYAGNNGNTDNTGNTDDTDDNTDNTNNNTNNNTNTTNTTNNQESQSIYNTLFGEVQQDEERDGVSYYVNRFFSSVQDLFN